MNLHGIKFNLQPCINVFKKASLLQAYASMYAMKSNPQVTASLKQKKIKHCTNKLSEVYVYSISGVYMVYNVLKLSI